MDWYALFKFLHVAASIIWIGAGFGLVVLGVAAKRAGDRESYLRVIQQVIFLSPRVFMPASLSAFVFGAITAWQAWSLSYLWIWLGLIGFAATFTTGNFLIRPRAEQVTKLVAGGGYNDHVNAVAEEILSIAQFDYLMLFVVVADMVFKPSLADWPVLLVFAIVLLAGAAFFLQPVLRQLPMLGARSQ